MRMRCLSRILLIIVISVLKVSSQNVSTFSCTQTTQYFDTIDYSCNDCPTNMVQNTSFTQECICDSSNKYFRSPNKPAYLGFTNGDADLCRLCNTAAGCNCTSTQKLGYYELDGDLVTNLFCIDCATNAYPSDDFIYCKRCPHYSQVYGGNSSAFPVCTCVNDGSITYVQAGAKCVRSVDQTSLLTYGLADSITLGSQITYKLIPGINQQTVQSQAISQNFLYYQVGCIIYSDSQHCQGLANFCVLNLYRATTIPCLIFINGRLINGNPIIYYSQNVRALQNSDLQASFTFNEGDVTSSTFNQFKIFSAEYDVDGNLLDFTEVEDLVLLCPHDTEDNKRWKTFGVNYEISCSINTTDFLTSPLGKKFFEFFIQDSDDSFIPIPVLITNYEDANGNYPNAGSDKTQWKLVTRFQIIDNIGSIDGVEYTNPSLIPKVLRFAETIELRVTMAGNSDTKIFVPYLAITYAERTYQNGRLVNPSAQLVYRTDHIYTEGNFWNVATGIFVLFLALVLIQIFFKMQTWSLVSIRDAQLNKDNEDYYWRYFVKLIEVSLGSLTYSFFYYILIFTGYWFVFYKMQSTATVLMPSETEHKKYYTRFESFFYPMFALNLVYVFLMIRSQTAIDIFFIDWEEQKNYIDKEDQSRGLSVWRTLFVANEFNELNVTRDVSPIYTLIFAGFFLSGLKMENYASEIPTFTTDNSNLQQNEVLKFFISIFLFFLIGIVQIIIERIVLCLKPSRAQDFIDFISVANISIMILDEDIHGFYLHGKNPNQTIEGDVFWLQNALDKESEKKLSRGMEGQSISRPQAPSDEKAIRESKCQTYEIVVDTELRKKFNEMKKIHNLPPKPLAKPKKSKKEQNDPNKQEEEEDPNNQNNLNNSDDQLEQEHENNTNKKKNKNQDRQESQKKQEKRYKKEMEMESQNLGKQINEIEQQEKNVTQESLRKELIKKKLNIQLKQTIINLQLNSTAGNFMDKDPLLSIIDRLPKYQMPNQQPIFYRDYEFNFKKILFMGKEMDLLVSDTYIFGFFQLITGSTLGSILGTFIVNAILTYLRDDKGCHNIAQKTYIDSMFLI